MIKDLSSTEFLLLGHYLPLREVAVYVRFPEFSLSAYLPLFPPSFPCLLFPFPLLFSFIPSAFWTRWVRQSSSLGFGLQSCDVLGLHCEPPHPELYKDWLKPKPKQGNLTTRSHSRHAGPKKRSEMVSRVAITFGHKGTKPTAQLLQF